MGFIERVFGGGSSRGGSSVSLSGSDAGSGRDDDRGFGSGEAGAVSENGRQPQSSGKEGQLDGIEASGGEDGGGGSGGDGSAARPKGRKPPRVPKIKRMDGGPAGGAAGGRRGCKVS